MTEYKNHFPQERFEFIDECEEEKYKEIILIYDDELTGEYRYVSNYG